MEQENIIKKESKIYYKAGFLKTYVGDLILNKTELYFADKKGDKKIIIPIKSILNVGLSKSVGSKDVMAITFKISEEERIAKFQHFSLMNSYLSVGNITRITASFFAPWQEAIENLRKPLLGI